MFSPYEKKILDRLTTVFSPVSDILQIVVFGSRSRGQSHETSDLDVMLVFRDKNLTTLQAIQSLKAKALTDVEDFSYVNLYPIKESNFYSSDGAFQQSVQNEGITIWSRKKMNPSTSN